MQATREEEVICPRWRERSIDAAEQLAACLVARPSGYDPGRHKEQESVAHCTELNQHVDGPGYLMSVQQNMSVRIIS